MSADALMAQLTHDTAARLGRLAAERQLGHVNERDHQAKCFVAAADERLAGSPYRTTAAGERRLSWPRHWPRIGDVDALLVPRCGDEPVFVELKCGTKVTSLRACGWDAVKCAVALGLGEASEAYLLAGTETARWRQRVLGSGLFAERTRWRSEDARIAYSAAFVEYEQCDDPPPRCVPSSFETELVTAADFLVGGTPWQLCLARVTASGDDWFKWDPFLSPAEQQEARAWRERRASAPLGTRR